jgi:hypothetical protein
MRLATILGALALTLFGLSACGSSKKELPAAEFAQKADAICAQTGAKRKAFGPAPNFNPATATPAQLKSAAKYLKGAAGVTKDEISQVNALGEPKESGPKQAWKKLHSDLESVRIPGQQKAADAAQAGDVKAFLAAVKPIEASSPEQQKLGATIGLKVCGNG